MGAHDEYRQWLRAQLRRRGADHVKQAGAANVRVKQHVVGPHCYLPGYGRHPAPFSKTSDGGARRAARQHKARQRAALLQQPTYDDGYFPLKQ